MTPHTTEHWDRAKSDSGAVAAAADDDDMDGSLATSVVEPPDSSSLASLVDLVRKLEADKDALLHATSNSSEDNEDMVVEKLMQFAGNDTLKKVNILVDSESQAETATVTENKNFWENLKKTGFNFAASGNPVASRFDRAKRTDPAMFEKYKLCKTREEAAKFRREWAQGRYDEFIKSQVQHSDFRVSIGAPWVCI